VDATCRTLVDEVQYCNQNEADARDRSRAPEARHKGVHRFAPAPAGGVLISVVAEAPATQSTVVY